MGLTLEKGPDMALAEVHEAPTLEELATTATLEHNLVLRASADVIAHSIAAGMALLEARRAVPRNHWKAWLEENFAGNYFTAARYMRFAKHREVLHAAKPTKVKEACLLINGLPDSRIDEDAVDEARRLRAQGMTYDDIAEQLGAGYQTVWRWLNPTAATVNRNRERQKRGQLSRAARIELQRQERTAAAKATGGALGEAYTLVSKLRQSLDRALGETQDRDVRKAINAALSDAFKASDAISEAVRLS